MLLSLENSFEYQNIFVHFSGLRFLVLHFNHKSKEFFSVIFILIFRTLHKDSVKNDNFIIKIFTWVRLFEGGLR